MKLGKRAATLKMSDVNIETGETEVISTAHSSHVPS